ncbi:hypothetical protein [Pseudomonas monteilii]|nr:hypothetical protein [Pseudomonas monteilii]MBA6105313.1 hypothetical protein [Pseudomonas monteilii]
MRRCTPNPIEREHSLYGVAPEAFEQAGNRSIAWTRRVNGGCSRPVGGD